MLSHFVPYIFGSIWCDLIDSSWYFIFKIILTYCKKKYKDREKLLKLEADDQQFAKIWRSLEKFIWTKVKPNQKNQNSTCKRYWGLEIYRKSQKKVLFSNHTIFLKPGVFGNSNATIQLKQEALKNEDTFTFYILILLCQIFCF